MPFSVKMAASDINLYKKEKRRENRSKVRQALFISDYMFYKHFEQYQEAAQLYNQINRLYPRKPDLRRTIEFKAWKNTVTGQSSTVNIRRPSANQIYVFPAHADILVPQVIDPCHSFTVLDQSESQQERPESPEPESQQQQERSEGPRADKGKRVMELKIPLMSTSNKDNPEPTISTQTLQTVTDEVLQEGDLQPSLFEEISPQIIERIMAELRDDPGLKDIMTEVEEQIELEEMDIGIDIDIEDRLEAELENIF